MDAVRLFWRASGALLALLALAGFALVSTGQRGILSPFMLFDTPQNALHAALAVVALALGFAPVPARLSRRLALVVGVLFVALGVAGFVSPYLFGAGRALGTHMDLGENLTHLALGAWGAYAGTNEAEGT